MKANDGGKADVRKGKGARAFRASAAPLLAVMLAACSSATRDLGAVRAVGSPAPAPKATTQAPVAAGPAIVSVSARTVDDAPVSEPETTASGNAAPTTTATAPARAEVLAGSTTADGYPNINIAPGDHRSEFLTPEERDRLKANLEDLSMAHALAAKSRSPARYALVEEALRKLARDQRRRARENAARKEAADASAAR